MPVSHSKVCIQFEILPLSARCEQHRLDLQRLAPSRFCILWSQHSRSHTPRAGCLYSIWNHSCVEQRKNKVDSNWIKELSIEWVFYLANLNWMLELKWFISSRKLVVGKDNAVHHQNRLTCQRMQFETKWAEFKEFTGSNSSHGTFGVSTVLDEALTAVQCPGHSLQPLQLHWCCKIPSVAILWPGNHITGKFKTKEMAELAETNNEEPGGKKAKIEIVVNSMRLPMR